MRTMAATVLASFLLILGTGIFCGHYSRRAADDFSVAVERIAADAERADWEKVTDGVRALQRQWEKRSDLMSLWANHDDLEAITIGLTRLRTAAEDGQRYYTLLYAAELDDALELIYSRDAFSLKNIF